MGLEIEKTGFETRPLSTQRGNRGHNLKRTFDLVDEMSGVGVPDPYDILKVRAGDDEFAISREVATCDDATMAASPLSQT